MEVRFREVDPFNCWIWLRFADPPGQAERSYVETVFDSWFFLGKLGAFNAETLQAHEAGADLSWLAWEAEGSSRALPALMHNMAVMEYLDTWGRCWLDLGTSDALALDVLINALGQLNNDVVEIEELLIGGINEDWPIEDDPDSPFAIDDEGEHETGSDSDSDSDSDNDNDNDNVDTYNENDNDIGKNKSNYKANHND
jgi:hypothetical protein